MQDSIKNRISRLQGLSHQDTTSLRREAVASEREITAAEATIPDAVDIPDLMTSVDAVARRYRLKSGPLAPDTAVAAANQVAILAAPYGAETFRVTVTGAWGDVVEFVDALPAGAGRIMTVPAIRRLKPSRTGDGSITADIGISVVTRHALAVVVNAGANTTQSAGTNTGMNPSPNVGPIGGAGSIPPAAPVPSSSPRPVPSPTPPTE
ncbi:MAG: hypothetical protein ACR2M1_17350 [Gemmatimonadaceae bacterium]